MADSTLYDLSQETFADSTPFLKKEVVWLTDSNGGSYSSGSVVFEGSSLSNSGKWVDWSNAILHIPVVVVATSAAGDIGLYNNAMSIAPLGWHHFLDSCTIEYNNKSVTQQVPRLNQYITWKLLTKLSQDDLKRLGPTLGWYPDETGAQFTAAANAGGVNGIGVTNNRNQFPVSYVPANGYNSPIGNGGMFKRQLVSNFHVTDAAAVADAAYNPSTNPFTTSAIAATTFRNHYTYEANVRATWYWDAQIRLRDISSFFENAPLLRSSYIRITLGINTTTHSIRIPAGAARAMRLVPGASNIQGNTCPWMVASTAVNMGSSNLPLDGGADRTVVVTQKIGSATVNGVQYNHPSSTSCRLYVPIFTMTAQAESDYMTISPIKTIPYTDLYYYQITNIAAGGNTNTLCSNGISNLVSLLLIPYYAASQHPVGGIGANAYTLSEQLSPFDSAPNTTLPYASLTNLQIAIGGTNLLSEYQTYEWQQWLDELKQTGLNGGQTDAMSSGLIDYLSFMQGNRYYYFDISRRNSPEEDAIPKSINVSFTNSSNVPIDVHVYAVYRRSVAVDLASGALLDQ